ncbi:MAG TPA: 5'-3' exonuclease H3TH domain-containing protein [Rudaea sp.]|jgi:5'-3' exonuclease|nr:5'-3' exonuclease H3TH domain-containing protein [Rudaea sp.]
MSASGTLYLIDGSLYVFRAWHSIPSQFHDHEGAPVNAVYGFTRFLCDFLEKTKPTHAVVAFDESLTSSFRNTIYPDYKANRELPPDELRRQFAYCKEIAAALGLCVLAHEHYEADDLIGSAVVGMRKHGFRSVVVSADKDFAQLIEIHDEQWDFPRDVRWNPDGVKQRLGVRPDQVVDFLALTGDAIDNIPGVPGIGAKTAATLLAHFGSLDEILKRVEEIPYLRMRSAAQIYLRLKEHREQALLSRLLSAIALDAPVPPHADGMTWLPPDLAAIEVLMEKLRFGPLTRSRMRGFALA